MKTLLTILSFATIQLYAQNGSYEKTTIYKTKFDDAIPVLNVGTFHMGESNHNQ